MSEVGTFIQWKGTNVCMDVYCKCGDHFHIDGYFAYFIKCNSCGTFYECGTKVELTEVPESITNGNALTDEG